MLMALVGLLLMQVEPPTTVNGQRLGSADQYRTDGPATVCMRNLVLTIRPGEAAYLRYAGIHWGGLRLVVAGRAVDFQHGEMWAPPRERGTPIERRPGGVRIFQTERDGALAYLVIAPDQPGNKPRPLIWISGSALSGRSTDRALLNRMVLESRATPCTRRYDYGWDLLLGDEAASSQE